MALHSHVLHNSEILATNSAALFPGQFGLLSGWGVFSTLRVRSGAPFAWRRHWRRMERDARLLHVPMPSDPDAVERNVRGLIAANGAGDCVLRLAIVRNGGGFWEEQGADRPPSDVIGLTAGLKQWPASVRLSVQPNARFAASEFAGTKILSWGQNLTWAERAQQAGFDEALLLNEHGRAAECTSANIFAVFGGEVLTPPLSEGCLPGITREVLLREIRAEGIRIREEALCPDDLFRADSVFITSTTRDLLSVREIGGRAVKDAGDVREHLLAEFRAFVDADIARDVRSPAGA